MSVESNCGQPFQFSGRGEVWSYSTVYDPPEGFEEQAPYTVALIKLDEGPLVTAQLTDLDTSEEEKETVIPGMTENGKVVKVKVRVTRRIVEIGMRVEMVTRLIRKDGDRGVLVYGYKFIPELPRLTVSGGSGIDDNSGSIYNKED